MLMARRGELLGLTVFCVAACATSNSARRAGDEMERAEAAHLSLALARTYMQNGAYTAALPLLQRGTERQPDSPEIRTLLAIVLRERGLYVQSKEEFMAAIALAERFAPAYAGLGMLYDLQGQHEEARKQHEKAVALAPGHGAYRNNLGFSLLLAGDAAAAIIQLERALADDPNLTVAYNNLGFAYAKEGRYDDALRSFRAISPEEKAMLNLALAYERNGEIDKANELREQFEPREPFAPRGRSEHAAEQEPSPLIEVSQEGVQ